MGDGHLSDDIGGNLIDKISIDPKINHDKVNWAKLTTFICTHM
jgi:hypothetical protein